MLQALPIPLLLLVLAVAMLVWHWRSWHDRGQHEPDTVERGYYERQFRRRMQASSLLALLSFGMYVGQLIPRREMPSLFVFVWFGVVVLVAWMVLLALADMLDNRYRLARLRDERRVLHAQLEAELDRARARVAAKDPPANGKA